MSIVLPVSCTLKRISSDRFAPSKALQDAKEKLGPVYYDSKLVECPQNAVELAKYLQTLEGIDKKRFKAEEESRRNQRILLHNLQTRYSFTRKTSLQDFKVTDVKLPPAGFRFHADGTRKLCKVPIISNFDSAGTGNHVIQDDVSESHSSEFILNRSYLPHSYHGFRNKSSILTDESDDEPLLGTDDDLLKVSEKLIKQIKKELELNQRDLKTRTTGSSREVKNSHGITFHIAPPSLPSKKLLKDKKSEVNSVDRRSSCSACHYSAKHSGENFKAMREKLNRKPITPWRLSSQARSLEIKPASDTSANLRKKSKISYSNLSKGTSNASKLKNSSAKLLTVGKDGENTSSDQISRQRRKSAGTKQSTLGQKQTSMESNIILNRSRSLDLLKQQMIEDQRHCEERIEDFLGRLKIATEKPKPKLAFV